MQSRCQCLCSWREACRFAAGVFWLIDRLPTASRYELNVSFHAILGQTPRIVGGRLAAFLVGEFVNSYMLARMKVATGGRWL